MNEPDFEAAAFFAKNSGRALPRELSDDFQNICRALLALLDERERANALLSRAEWMLSSLDYTRVPAEIRAHLERKP